METAFFSAAKACEEVADVAVVVFDRNGQVFAGEEPVFRDQAAVALPVVGDASLAFEADFGEKLLGSSVITATKTQAMVRPATES